MRRVAQLCTGLLTAGAAACASTTASLEAASAVGLSPVVVALTTRVPDLEARAAAGDSTAQYALALVRQHGLRGVAADAQGAAELKAAAAASRGSTAITQYIAGINGAPGRVHIINLPKGGALGPGTAKAAEACVAELRRWAVGGYGGAAALVFLPEQGPTTAGVEPTGEAATEPPPAEEAAPGEAVDEAEETDGRTACGDRERTVALGEVWANARPWSPKPLPRCGAGESRCAVLRAKVERLNRRDPAAEARAATARGDFRLGAYNHIGPMPRGWETVGVTCRAWTRELVGKWHVNQDVVRPGDPEHSAAALAFLAAYNQALVSDPAFPYPDVCAPDGLKPLPRYPGPVRTAAEAARSGDAAKLAALPAGSDVNAPDPFGRPPLAVAMANGDEAMARALLERGADPNAREEDEPAPLAVAIDEGRFELARLMEAKGARMTGGTGLCDLRGVRFFDPEEETVNRKCSWAGLLIAKSQFDWLDEFARVAPRERAPQRETLLDLDRADTSRPEGLAVLDGFDELEASFFAAVAERNEPVISRLLPYVGQGLPAAFTLARLYKLQRPDLVRGIVLAGHGSDAARSPSEAQLWRTAARAKQDSALAFLYDFGADLNLLPAERLAACDSAAGSSDIRTLLACVKEAADRRAQLLESVAAGDRLSFDRLVAEAADLRERRKATVVDLVGGRLPVANLARLLQRGAAPGTNDWTGSGAADRVFAGAELAEAESAVAAARNARSTQAPVVTAALRGDAAVVRLLADAGAPNLIGGALAVAELGGSPKVDTFSDEPQNTSLLPAGPEPSKARAFDLLASEIARLHGSQSLEYLFRHTVVFGYDDLSRALVARGYRPAKAAKPDRIWHAWSGLGHPCKPSTARFLIEAGLPYAYPVPTDFTNERPLHGMAATCVNPASVSVLVAGPAEVNELNLERQTALDRALQYRKTHLADALRALGGKTATEVAPAKVAADEAKARAEDDLDLEQSERT